VSVPPVVDDAVVPGACRRSPARRPMVLALVPESPLIRYKSPAGGLGRLVALGRERAYGIGEPLRSGYRLPAVQPMAGVKQPQCW
jgi:hypothetical protein